MTGRGRHVVRLALVVFLVGSMASGVPFMPTAGYLSDGSSFDDNHVGAADEWGNVTFDADAPAAVDVSDEATLEVTVENTGDTVSSTEYEVVIDGETVDEGYADLEVDGEWTDSYEFDADESGEIDWTVTVDGESQTGTLSVDGNDTVGADDG